VKKRGGSVSIPVYVYSSTLKMNGRFTVAHKFTLNKESLKRKFAVYVVVASGRQDTKLYVGKTGDNREGCNPVISRCGNHFSYNKVHSQVRNKIRDHENRQYTYIFDLFDAYHTNPAKRRRAIDRINEMERWLNREVQAVIRDWDNCELLNPYSGSARVPSIENARRSSFRTKQARRKILGIVADMRQEISAGSLIRRIGRRG